MNSLVIQDPWSFVSRLQTEINRIFGNANQSDSSSATANWVPAVDIHEYTDRLELYVDVPGIDPGNVELTLQGGILTLSGQRTAPEFGKPDEKPQYTRSERGLGHFYRRFVIPDSVDSEKVNATGKNGVLTITIAKQAKAMPRRIPIGA
jgi:HSP20 family protein